jgi:hypothetical protein
MIMSALAPTSRRIALVATGGLLAALSLGGIAQAVTDKIFRYTTARTGYFGIDHMAMAPRDASSANDYVVSWGTGLYPQYLTGTGGCHQSGVHLPNGATIVRLLVWTRSSSVSGLNVYLYRHKYLDGTQDTIASKHIPDNSNTRIQTRIAIANNSFAVVNNAAYSYGFGVCLSASALFHSARVAYTYTHAGD